MPNSKQNGKKSFGRDEGRGYGQHDSMLNSPRQARSKTFNDDVHIHNPKTKGKGEKWASAAFDDSDRSSGSRSPHSIFDFDDDNETVITSNTSGSGLQDSRRKHRRDSSYSSFTHAPREHARRSSPLGNDFVMVSKKEIADSIAAASVLRQGATQEVDRPQLSSRAYTYGASESQGYRSPIKDDGWGLARRLSAAVPRRDVFAINNERRLNRSPESDYERRQRGLRLVDEHLSRGTRTRDYQDRQHILDALVRGEEQDQYYGRPGRLASDFQTRKRATARSYV